MYRVSLHKNHGCQKFWSLELSNHQYIKAVPPFKTKHATSSKISCGKPLEPKHPPQAYIERNNHPYPVTKLLYPYPRGRSPHHFPSTRTEGVQSTNDARGTAPHLSKASKRRHIPLPCHTAPSSKRGTCYLAFLFCTQQVTPPRAILARGRGSSQKMFGYVIYIAGPIRAWSGHDPKFHLHDCLSNWRRLCKLFGY